MNQPTFPFHFTSLHSKGGSPDSCNIMGRVKAVAADHDTKTKSNSNPSASPEVVLLHRMDLIDVRLKQLEEKQRVPESYFAADLRREAVNFGQRQCRSFSSALQEVHIKGTLMDRLRLLENRILLVYKYILIK
ncbi:hypothetical protein QJS04_geneDACA001411 [Acorus gramineus]|uniref:Uncharacterized protein n=1 Tax=Acorus gramineus TaxID=55184 RepID=A0AAV9A5Y4_ACOGR|nr:hypothetical protein QJS04_geneDACA001411 [Acorus gramineus]